ncbi:MAG: ABC transporter ATP-binding protein [Spirochaetota bacterium]
MSRVDFDHVWKIYPRGNVTAVKDLTFTCNDGEFMAILGPSGSGKSSTLRMLAGLEDITRGKILFDDHVVNHLEPAQRNIALAFETYALYQRMSVYENIAFPLRARKMKGPEVDRKVKWVSDILDLDPVLDTTPGQLSGGHQQRVGLARAFVREPNVTLLDEPISHMDQRVRHELRARIRRLHEDLGLTTVYVTHDQAEAVSLCDRMIILHQAEMQQIGTVEEIWNKPANRFVAYFVGEPAMNFIDGIVENCQSVTVPTGEGRKVFSFNGKIGPKYVGSNVSIGVRPQQIHISRKKEKADIPGTVKVIEFQGDRVILTVMLSDKNHTEIKAVVSAGEKYKREENVRLHFPPDYIHLFDGDTPVIKRD